jgi:hypothetical protein
MKNLLLAVLLFTGITYASAQDVYTSSGRSGYHKKAKKHKGYDPDKLILGGGLTASFGGGYANVGVSPIVGYRFTEHFTAGIGLGYLYSQIPVYVDPVDPYKVSYVREHIIYPSVWTRLFVIKNFFLSASYEYDIINQRYPGYVNGNTYPTTIKLNVDNSCVFVGAGLRMPLGGRSYLYGEMLYDVIQGKYSPYAPGFPTTLRVGFAAGL